MKALEEDTQEVLDEKTEFHAYVYNVNADKRQLTSRGNKLTMNSSVSNGEIIVINDSSSQKQI